MIVLRINKTECAALLIEHNRLEQVLGREVGWFVDKSQAVIGIIGMGPTDNSWRLAVLTRRLNGRFQLCDMRCHGLYSFIAARAELLRNMMSLGTRPAPAAIGNLVWSQT